MEITLQRDTYTTLSTLGVLSITGDPSPSYQTLELPRKDGLPGSCIPAGRYRVTIAFSPHFQRRMPLIVGIPNRSEIEIHWGDFPENTRGCVLVGETRGENAIYNTIKAFDSLFPKIENADQAEGCWITVVEFDHVVGGVEEVTNQ
jgi:Family of unknown function (DUF5675)